MSVRPPPSAAEDRFLETVAEALRARIDAEGLGLREVAEAIGIPRRSPNYPFRILQGAGDAMYRAGVPRHLANLLSWLSLEPRDFAEAPEPLRPFDLVRCINRLEMPNHRKAVLKRVVFAFLEAEEGVWGSP